MSKEQKRWGINPDFKNLLYSGFLDRDSNKTCFIICIILWFGCFLFVLFVYWEKNFLLFLYLYTMFFDTRCDIFPHIKQFCNTDWVSYNLTRL